MGKEVRDSPRSVGGQHEATLRESVAGWGQSGACVSYFKRDVANRQQNLVVGMGGHLTTLHGPPI